MSLGKKDCTISFWYVRDLSTAVDPGISTLDLSPLLHQTSTLPSDLRIVISQGFDGSTCCRPRAQSEVNELSTICRLAGAAFDEHERGEQL
jgi:hypothetical protein